MSKPIVAVVGRPNVGKSTLFNKLCGQRLAIVEDTPGITRDRIFANCEWSGHEFLLVDTGGIEPKATEGILAHMREQAQIAIDTADCIIMVVSMAIWACSRMWARSPSTPPTASSWWWTCATA